VLEGSRLVGFGILPGLGVALAVGPYAQHLLFQVSPRDPWVFGGVATAVTLVAILSSSLPGLRATRVDPAVALRTE